MDSTDIEHLSFLLIILEDEEDEIARKHIKDCIDLILGVK